MDSHRLRVFEHRFASFQQKYASFQGVKTIANRVFSGDFAFLTPPHPPFFAKRKTPWKSRRFRASARGYQPQQCVFGRVFKDLAVVGTNHSNSELRKRASRSVLYATAVSDCDVGSAPARLGRTEPPSAKQLPRARVFAYEGISPVPTACGTVWRASRSPLCRRRSARPSRPRKSCVRCGSRCFPGGRPSRNGGRFPRRRPAACAT